MKTKHWLLLLLLAAAAPACEDNEADVLNPGTKTGDGRGDASAQSDLQKFDAQRELDTQRELPRDGGG
jgi:hypothetical protein